MRSRRILSLGIPALLGIATACEAGKPAGEAGPAAEAVVKGFVRIRGRKATAGEVVFLPTRPDAKPRTAAVAEDGSFAATTDFGDNLVTVKGPRIDGDPILSTNRQLVDVEPGENTRDIDL